jgi:hypothetical protein
LVAGVKMGCAQRLVRAQPGRQRMPQTVPLALYSFQPEPAT